MNNAAMRHKTRFVYRYLRSRPRAGSHDTHRMGSQPMRAIAPGPTVGSYRGSVTAVILGESGTVVGA